MKILSIILIFTISLLAFADVKISQLPLGTAPNVHTSDAFPFVDTSVLVTRRLKISDLPYTPAFQVVLAGKASTGLTNISNVSLSSDLLPGSTATISLGSSTLAFLNAFIVSLKDTTGVVSVDPLNRLLLDDSGVKVLDYSGSSVIVPSLSLDGGTLGVVRISSASVASTYQVIFPATGGSTGQILKTNGVGTLAWVYHNSVSVVDGGDAPYSVQAYDGLIRAGTTLTGGQTYTLPPCTFSNIGERHVLKDPPGQGFNVTVAGAFGTDLIDASNTATLTPGDSISVICAAFNGIGIWDVE